MLFLRPTVLLALYILRPFSCLHTPFAISTSVSFLFQGLLAEFLFSHLAPSHIWSRIHCGFVFYSMCALGLPFSTFWCLLPPLAPSICLLTRKMNPFHHFLFLLAVCVSTAKRILWHLPIWGWSLGPPWWELKRTLWLLWWTSNSRILW